MSQREERLIKIIKGETIVLRADFRTTNGEHVLLAALALRTGESKSSIFRRLLEKECKEVFDTADPQIICNIVTNERI